LTFEREIVTFAAWITRELQLTVLASMTVFAVVTVHGPVYVVSGVPAGTPVVLASGHPEVVGAGLGAGLVVGLAVGVGDDVVGAAVGVVVGVTGTLGVAVWCGLPLELEGFFHCAARRNEAEVASIPAEPAPALWVEVPGRARLVGDQLESAVAATAVAPTATAASTVTTAFRLPKVPRGACRGARRERRACEVTDLSRGDMDLQFRARSVARGTRSAPRSRSANTGMGRAVPGRNA